MLAVKQGAVGFLEITTAAGAMQLSSGAAAGMTVGADIASPDPALVGTVRMRAEVPRGVHLVPAAPCRGDRRRWGQRELNHGRLGSLLTGGTGRLISEARKGFRLVGALAG